MVGLNYQIFQHLSRNIQQPYFQQMLNFQIMLDDLKNKIFPKKLGEWRMRCLTGSEGMLPKLSKAWTGAMVAKILVTKYSRMDQVKFVEDSL